jgi:hypothetical protein
MDMTTLQADKLSSSLRAPVQMGEEGIVCQEGFKVLPSSS